MKFHLPIGFFATSFILLGHTSSTSVLAASKKKDERAAAASSSSGGRLRGGGGRGGGEDLKKKKKPHYQEVLYGNNKHNADNNNNNNGGNNNNRILTKDIKPHKVCDPPAIQYIVTCKDNKETECRDELEQQGVDIIHMIHGTKYFAVCVDSPDDYVPLMELADVETLEEDQPRHFMKPVLNNKKAAAAATSGDAHHRNLSAEQVIPYGVEMVHAPGFWETFGAKGDGVRVCVIDTGIDMDHVDLIPGDDGSRIIDGSNEGDLIFPWNEDGYGHGTHVAGTIAAAENGIGVVGVSPNVDLFIARVFDNNGSGFTTSSLIDAMNECELGGSNIINMSLGGPGSSLAESDLIDAMTDRGVLLVAAAGNDGEYGSPMLFPAGYDSVMSVAAIDENADIASWSTHNDAVDIAAPGVDVESLETGGGTTFESGTSMACPHVSAVAALLMSKYPNEPTSRIREAMENSALDLGSCGTDTDYGHGLVDAVAAATYLESGVSGRADDLQYCWQCNIGEDDCDSITVKTFTDEYGEETSWKIYQNGPAGEEIVLRGGPYESIIQAEYTETFSLPRITEGGCYEFRIEDASGDGTCCAYGQGSHEFIFNGEQLLFEDQFESGTLSVTFGCADDNTAYPLPSLPPSSESPSECSNLNGWVDIDGLDCSWFESNDSPGCPAAGNSFVPESGITPNEACCYCGGGSSGEGDSPLPSLPPSSGSPSECDDFNGWVDIDGDDCSWYEGADSPGCPNTGNSYIPESGIAASEACCYCGGGGGGGGGSQEAGLTDEPNIAWRILTQEANTESGSLWNVLDLKFFRSADCSGDYLPRNGLPIASGSANNDDGNVHSGPQSAFDNYLGTKWGGKSDEFGYLWVGMEFDTTTDVGCVEVLSEHGNGATEITVQVRDSSSSQTWRDVMTATNVEYSAMIPLIGG